MARSHRTTRLLSAFALLFTLAAASAPAQTTWNGSVSTNWHNLANWDTVGEIDHVPDGTDNVIIPPTGIFVPRQPTISNGNAICNALKIESGAVLTMSGGTYRSLKVESDWTNNGTFNAGSHRVWLTGTGGVTSVAGTESTSFNDLRIDCPTTHFDTFCEVFGDFEVLAGASVVELNASLSVWGDCTAAASGISFSGSGALYFEGWGTTYSNNVVLPQTIVAGGIRTLQKCRFAGSLAMWGGLMLIDAGAVVTVDGPFYGFGGQLGASSQSPGARVLDVNGDATLNCADATGSYALTADTVVRCSGDWSATSAFDPVAGTVELDGVGTTEIRSPWSDRRVVFHNLVVKNGSRVVPESLEIVATTRRVQEFGAVYVLGDWLALPSGTLEIASTGSFHLFASRALRCGPTTEISATAGSGWYMIGDGQTPTGRTRVESMTYGDGGYGMVLDGFVAARTFAIGGTGPAGLVIGPNATFAGGPNDLRDGIFDAPSAAAGATQLTMSRNQPIVLRYLAFASNLLIGSNVKATTTAPVVMVNWSGSHGGEGYDDDPLGVVSWPPPTTTVLESFAATPGPQRVTASFTTTSEVDVERFLLELETAPGDFTTIREFFPTGFGTYVHLDAPLVPGVARTYRLAEKLTHGAVRYLAQGTATPWSATPPASVARVSPAGPYFDVQSAVAAAAGPTLTVRVAAGTYPAFTIGSAAPQEIEVAPDGSGPVTFDASSAPILISSRPWNSSVLLSGATVFTGTATHPGVVVQYSPFAVVVLDDLTVNGSASAAGVRCDAASVVAIQECRLSGAPGLHVTAGSDVLMGRGTLDEGVLEGGSRLRSMGLSAPMTVEPFSVHQAFPGIMPRATVPRFASLLEPFTVLLEGAAGATWIGGVSVALRHFDLSPEPFLMSELIDLYAILFLFDGGFDPFGEDERPMTLPADPSLIGKTFHLQIVSIEPGSYAWSNVASLVAVP